MKKFWLVWNPEKPRSEHQHDSRISAENEAVRLAEKEVGTFIVLEAVCYKRSQVSIDVLSGEFYA